MYGETYGIHLCFVLLQKRFQGEMFQVGRREFLKLLL